MVKRGLRDINGKGVLVGLTEISDVCSTKIVDGVSQPADGELYYRGYNVKDIIAGIDENSHFGFEECTYLLLFGSLPTKDELKEFTKMLSKYRSLPTSFVRDIIKEKTGKEPLDAFTEAMNNIMPSLEVKARRVGGATYQVPMEVRPERRQTLGLRWLTGYARKRSEKTMKERLAGEIMDACNNTGAAVKKREDTHKMAESNKAFAHFRW